MKLIPALVMCSASFVTQNINAQAIDKIKAETKTDEMRGEFFQRFCRYSLNHDSEYVTSRLCIYSTPMKTGSEPLSVKNLGDEKEPLWVFYQGDKDAMDKIDKVTIELDGMSLFDYRFQGQYAVTDFQFKYGTDAIQSYKVKRDTEQLMSNQQILEIKGKELLSTFAMNILGRESIIFELPLKSLSGSYKYQFKF